MAGFKTGIDYFSLDVDFFDDEKIEFISARFGLHGELLTIKLLCRIYRSGYYINWGQDECLLFSKKAGVKAEETEMVIQELLKRNFFNQEMYERYGILTSNGIQKRYFAATSRRKGVFVRKEYLIADISGYNVNIIPENSHILSQSKVKESKVNNIYIGSEEEEQGKEEILPEKTNSYSELFEVWNNAGVIVHHKLTRDMRSAIDSARRDYSPEEITVAINNYAEILHGDDYYWSHKWTLAEFLSRRKGNNIERFLNISAARENFRKDKFNGAHQSGPRTSARALPKEYTNPEDL